MNLVIPKRMVLEVPTSTEFRDHGVDYLNIGWGTVVEILINLEDAGDYRDAKDLDEITPGFWSAAERELATALSLVEQGAEFLLKSRICEVSPWLLVTRNPSEWPKGCGQSDVRFAQFRTIDAQDLIKAHDTFAQQRLAEEFRETFDELRQQRNTVIHTVDQSMKFTAAGLLEQVLIVSEHLLGQRMWLQHRMEFLERDRHTAIYPDGGNDYRLAREFLAAAAILKPANLKRFFNFHKRQRAYLCPSCTSQDWGFDGRTAQLVPNSPTGTNLHCFSCGKDFPVTREHCKRTECKGNVYDPDCDRCLTCAH